MKRINIPRTILCLLLCTVLLAAPLTALAAGGTATVGIAAKQLVKIVDDSVNPPVTTVKFVATDSFDVTTESGSTVYIPVSITSSVNVGGVAFTLEYDKEILEFMPGSSLWLMGSGDAVSVHETENGAMIAWEESPVNMNGEIYYAAFRVAAISQSAETQVKVTLRQLFQGNATQDDIRISVTSQTVTVQLLTSVLGAGELAVFEKLETVTYPTSAMDIAAANKAFEALTPHQQQQLKKEHPQAYEWYQTAKTRYNRLADAAADQAVTQEISAYENANKAALALTPETVKVSDAEAVEKALTDMDALSDRAKVLVEKEYKELLKSLEEAIEELQDNQAEIDSFNERFGSLYVLDKATVEQDPTSYATMLDEALMVYNSLGKPAQEALKERAELFTQLREYCDEVLARDAAQEELMKEVSAFQSQWTDVLLLNSFTVTEGDETAILMALSAYERLSDEAKALLADRITTLEGLLVLIDGMGSEEKPGGTITVPGPGQVVEVEKEVPVEKPVYMTKAGPAFMIVLIILLVVTLVSFSLPFILMLLSKKKKRPLVKEETHE